jgi:hypothetical protein
MSMGMGMGMGMGMDMGIDMTWGSAGIGTPALSEQHQ